MLKLGTIPVQEIGASLNFVGGLAGGLIFVMTSHRLIVLVFTGRVVMVFFLVCRVDFIVLVRHCLAVVCVVVLLRVVNLQRSSLDFLDAEDDVLMDFLVHGQLARLPKRARAAWVVAFEGFLLCVDVHVLLQILA